MAFSWLRSRIAGRVRVRTELGYGVFVSYSGDRDRQWLPRLRRAIEKQSRPWYKPPRIRVFLDDSGITIGPRLWEKITAGLARSQWLVVMASPESRKSTWVDREIEWWLEHKAVDNVLLVVTAGQLVWDESRGDWHPDRSTALPERLLGRFEQEPVWKSVATRRDDGVDLAPDIDNVAVGIASVVRGLPESDLKSEGLRDTKRNLRTARIIAAVLGVLLLVASALSVVAVAQRDEATRQRDRAIAQQLISQSEFLATRDPFGARFAALAAWRIDPSPESRLAVLDAAVNPQSGLLTGHDRPVRSVAISPDGRTIASGGDDGTVRLWDAATQRKIGRSLVGHTNGVTSVAFAPDGKTLVSSSSDGTARLWNVADHTSRGAPFDPQTGEVSSVAISPDGRTLLTGDPESVREWDMATHRQIGEPLGTTTGYSYPEVAYSPDGTIIASGYIDGTVRLWDAASHAPLGDPLVGATNAIRSVSFSPDGRTLAAASADGGIRLWDTATRATIGEPFAVGAVEADTGLPVGVNSVAFSPDGAMFAAAYDDGSVRLWDIARHSQIGTPFTGHTSSAWAVAFSPVGSTVASSSTDTTVRLWDVRTQRQVGKSIGYGDRPIRATALSPDGQMLAVGSDDAVRFFDVGTRRQIGDALPIGAGTAVFSPDGAVLATADGFPEGEVRLWDVASRRQIGKPFGGETWIGGLAFSPDGKTLAGSAEESVRLWNTSTRRQIGVGIGTGKAGMVAFSPDGRTLATNEYDTVGLWDVATRRRIGETPPAHTAQIAAAAFSPDGMTLATASRDNTVRLWDVATREQIGAPLTGHRSGVTSVAFSPTGTTLATSSMDGTVRLWDVASRRQIGDPLIGHTGEVTDVTFGPDGKTLVSTSGDTVSDDNTVLLWDVAAVVAPVRSLCIWARGAFTADRWHSYVPPGPAARPLCPQ